MRLPLSRRAFLRASGAAGALATVHLIPGVRALAQTAAPLFSLGVASGEPAPESVVLWTRLAPDPLNGGGMPDRPVAVEWEVAADEQFGQVVRRGRTTAHPEDGHTVHVLAKGLRPERVYWYRFRAQGEQSRVGRTRTAPARGTLAQRLRFALVSCQDWANGYYAAYRDIAEQDLDLVVHVGDYIYEYAEDPSKVRLHRGGEPQTLADYRNRYALYRLDPQLQEVHALFPFLVTWDDHEVQDNYAGGLSEHGVSPEDFVLRRAAAYQAYFEHMPLRRSARPRKKSMTLYRRVDFGGLARIFMLDGRQFRTDQPCGQTVIPITASCPEDSAPTGTMLGKPQERWLLAGLKKSHARWNVIAQQVMMLRGDLGEALASPTPYFNMDAWDGYQAQRQRLLDFLARERPANPIVLTGDIHSAWAANLKQDFLTPTAPTVAVEFVCTSITSEFPAGFVPLIEANLGPTSRNPHILFFEGRKHGWLRCELTPDLWRSDFRVVDSILDPQAPASTVASWVVEDGVPGTRPA